MKSDPRKGAKDAHPPLPSTKKRCPSCGREADTLFHPVLPVPGEAIRNKKRPLVCPECCPRPPDETKS